jgi:hypothetical protein
VLGNQADPLLPARLWPENALRYVAVEDEIGHQFQRDLSMRSVAVEAGILPGDIGTS